MRGGALLAAATVVVAATACSGSGRDKAGGRNSITKPVVLTLVENDPFFGSAEFAAAVAERSRGSIRIEVRTRWRAHAIDPERRTVADIRKGTVPLGIVGARVWDTLGVDDFRPLLAPFLVDSLELERRVLESPLAPRMLAGVDHAGVVGIALLPGALRQPFGYVRPLIGPRDYAGARIGVKESGLEEATFRSLGATTRVYRWLGEYPRLTGAALDPWTIADNSYEGKAFVGNVVFWPRPETIVMNRRAFRALTPAQRQILIDAGRAAVERDLARLERVGEDAVRDICARELAPVVTASQADVMHEAVHPVYAQLERDAETRRQIAEIRKVRAEVGEAAEPLRCPKGGGAPASELEGRWRATATREQLFAAGASPREAGRGRSSLTLEFEAGRWVIRAPGTGRVWTGSYTVDGDVVRFTVETCSRNPCTPGMTSDRRWSVYRGTLSLKRLPGRTSWWQPVEVPFKRVR